MPIYKNTSEEHLGYIHSDMREYLNNGLLYLFPKKIRSRMCPMMVEDSYRDYLRIPTEKEIFGKNIYGMEESNTSQFYGMTHRRNRIAFEHTNGIDEWQWYWLQTGMGATIVERGLREQHVESYKRTGNSYRYI